MPVNLGGEVHSFDLSLRGYLFFSLQILLVYIHNSLFLHVVPMCLVLLIFAACSS